MVSSALQTKIIADNADDLFEQVINNMQDVKHPTVAKEIINANLVLTNPIKNTMCKCRRKMSIQYAVGELLWYQSRNRQYKAIEPYSKFWKNISDDGVFVNSNYGWCIHDKYGFDQWAYVKSLLTEDSDTRQAIMHIKEARNTIINPTKDLNCTMTLQFLMRDGKLNLITTMRSNDVWLGLPYDLFNFTCMQIQMAMELGVDIGVYCHNAGSLHLYKQNLDNLSKGGTNGIR